MDITHLKYPIYIVSKGRWENHQTARFMKSEGLPFRIAVEPQEYNNYCKTIGEKYIVKLPFSNLGLGSYPARNWCWNDSIKRGYKKHFLFDDNIQGFFRFNKGKRTNAKAIDALITLQKFTDSYNNIGISGYNYSYFVDQQTPKAFFLNTHVYSGMLINNSIPYRWRLKYNEDVDLCLQVLHNKLCTVALNVFLIKKTSTVAKMKGGNQTELYKNNNKDKKALKAISLQRVWPQYVKIINRFGRPHHSIGWNKFFKHPLKKCIIN